MNTVNQSKKFREKTSKLTSNWTITAVAGISFFLLQHNYAADI